MLRSASWPPAPAGRRVRVVRGEHMPQRCSQCGHTDKANQPDRATVARMSCGHKSNADRNAAANIAACDQQVEDA